MNLIRTTEVPRVPKLRGKGIIFPCWVEVKYDGEFSYLIQNDKETYYLNRYGTKRTLSCRPCRNVHSTTKLIGELYFGEGKKGDLYNLLSNKTNENSLTFRAFDIVELNGINVQNKPFAERRKLLKGVYPTYAIGKEVATQGELDVFYRQKVAEGYEGVVAKRKMGRLILDTNDWVKIKDKDENNYPIVMIDNVRERVEVQVVERTVGVKVPNKYKYTLAVGDFIRIEHQGILSGGGLRHPVYKGKATNDNI